MSSLVDSLIQRAKRNDFKMQSKESREWFRKNARKLGSKVRTSQLQRDRDRLRTRPKIGHLYLYNYDPKWKATLKFYDIFPLVFVVDFYNNGFLGLNLHYLPPKLRLLLLENLLRTRTNSKYDETTRLRISWSILKKFGRHNLVKPCVKRYLYKHLRSLYIEVPPEEWEAVVFLPVERFRKGKGEGKISNQTVWSDSKRISNG